MRVHRDNDDQSGGGKVSGKPRLVASRTTPVSDASGHADGSDDGKAHLIGDALKSVYQRTLEEEIPDDFLDLLKQLK